MQVVNYLNNTLTSLYCYLQVLSPRDYSTPLPILMGASIGQHTRHIVEFCQCLLQQYPQKQVSYDLRQRNLHLENHPSYALNAIAQVCEQIASLGDDKENTLNSELVLISHFHPDNPDEFIHTPTTLIRELVYNLEHAIHHMAIIRIGLNTIAPSLTVPDAFGIAPTTIHYQHQNRLQNNTNANIGS